MKRIEVPDKVCLKCGNAFNRKMRPSGVREGVTEFALRKFCSRECDKAFRVGIHHHAFKPEGSRRAADGYWRVTVNGRRVYRHRLAMEKVLGRELRPEENVHHKDETPGHDDPINLEIKTNSAHRKLHAAVQPRSDRGTFVCV